MTSPARCCCTPNPVSGCETYRPCYGDPCDLVEPWTVPGYVSIGRPVGPTKYDGPFWPAWHNGIVARNESSVSVNLKVNAYRRKIVQEGCPTCSALPTPTTGANCNSSGLIGARFCKRTEYIDNFSWVAAGIAYLKGGSKDQAECVHTSPTGEKYPAIPPGPYPYILTDCTRSLLSPNEPVATGTNPNWWPGENRRIVPRFYNALTVTASATPSSDFPQAATCGAAVTVNRCTSATVTEALPVCLDLPITIVPGHQTIVTTADIARCGETGACVCGQPTSPYTCLVDRPENGAVQAAWAIDVKNDKLYNALTSMGLGSANYIGELDKVWVTITAVGRVRFMFGAASRIGAGAVLRFPDGQTITETWSVSRAAAGESLTLSIDFSIQPKNWCRYSEPCGCVQSHCENGPGSVLVSLYTHTIGCGGPDGCGSNSLTAQYALALGDYTIPICAFPAICPGATTNCQQYPVTSACAAYHPTIRPDFVGAVPVERSHAGWRKYRNRYDHFLCVNNVVSGQSACCAGAVNLGGANLSNVCMGSCSAIDPTFSASHQPCPGTAAGCVPAVPAQTVPAGCHPVSYQSGNQRISALPDGASCMPCSSHFFECGPMYFAANCGSALYDVCDCCNTQVTVTLPEIIIVDWDPRKSCTPIGTWPAYAATSATICQRSAWTPIGTAVVS